MHYDAATGKERKLNRIKLSDQIAEDLRVRIARDGLQPGDRLPHERALMEYYGCSKGTMREALKALEVEGLVRMLSGPNGGPEIQSTSSDTVTQQLRQYLHFQKVDFTQVYELRRPLEVILVRDVIGRLTQAQIARLEENIRVCEEANAAQDRDLVNYRTASMREHENFGDANIQSHKQLLAALKAGDANAAAGIMHDHMCCAESYMRRLDASFHSDLLSRVRPGSA